MTGIYLFAAAAGVPLVVWFLLSGADDSTETAGVTAGAPTTGPAVATESLR